MATIDIIGFAAAAGTTFAFVPQVMHTVRTKDTKSISLYMYVVFLIGLSLWLVYGIMVQSVPVIAANAATIVLAGIVLYHKLRHG